MISKDWEKLWKSGTKILHVLPRVDPQIKSSKTHIHTCNQKGGKTAKKKVTDRGEEKKKANSEKCGERGDAWERWKTNHVHPSGAYG